MICWAVCFWWMHRLSVKQNSLLEQLREQAHRIERLSKAEHDLIKEVHPQVNEIKQGVEEVRSAVQDQAKPPGNSSPAKKRRWFAKKAK